MDTQMPNDQWNDEAKKKLTASEIKYAEAFLQTKSISEVAKLLNVTVSHAGSKIQDVRNKTKLDIFKSRLLQNKSNVATAKELLQLIKKQDYRCALSGTLLSPDSAALDHIVPVSKGGTDHISNLQWVDRTINRMKSNMEVQEFIAACVRVSQWTG